MREGGWGSRRMATVAGPSATEAVAPETTAMTELTCSPTQSDGGPCSGSPGDRDAGNESQTQVPPSHTKIAACRSASAATPPAATCGYRPTFGRQRASDARKRAVHVGDPPLISVDSDTAGHPGFCFRCLILRFAHCWFQERLCVCLWGRVLCRASFVLAALCCRTRPPQWLAQQSPPPSTSTIQPLCNWTTPTQVLCTSWTALTPFLASQLPVCQATADGQHSILFWDGLPFISSYPKTTAFHLRPILPTIINHRHPAFRSHPLPQETDGHSCVLRGTRDVAQSKSQRETIFSDMPQRALLHRARTTSAPWQLLMVKHQCTILRCTHPNSR